MRQKRFFSFKLFVPGFTIIFGLVLIVFAVMRVAQAESFIKRAERTIGTILEVHLSGRYIPPGYIAKTRDMPDIPSFLPLAGRAPQH